ncbi:MAG: hypothetical protein MUO89_03750 [Dehalococcoidia bacterium]|nr:hypothetical protein [Dehalococcoidia bacterium]
MVVANLRIAVEDPLVAARYGLEPDNVKSGEEPFFLDGPVAARVAVVDRDVKTGQLLNPVKWLPKKHTGTYAAPEDISSPEGIAVSIFGIVLETLAFFERDDVLGHKVKWAFDSPQLLVVPHAGIWKNAYYDRLSQSLQCFSFAGPNNVMVNTALSRDIVAHETGHAILDGIVPALYDALTPQTLALHEAIGDLTAIVMALQSRNIRDWLLREKYENLTGSTPVSQLAYEFGHGLGLDRPLRDAFNSAIMESGNIEPHDLCQVLTGAFWSAMVQMHQNIMDKARKESQQPGEGPIGRALGTSARRIGRILFRALDFLVPAEATFTDYCRAVLRSDEQVYPEDETGYRELLKKEFVKRGIVKSGRELESKPEQEWVSVDLNDIAESEWAAYAFVEKQRKLLKVPRGVPFRLFPRQSLTRKYYLRGGNHEDHREVVLRVTWETTEENVGISGMPRRRAVFHGTTAVFSDCTDKKGRHRLLSCLTTDRSDEHARTRNETVRNLVERSQLEIGDSRASFKARPLAPRVFGRVTDKTLRLRGTARLLHLTEVEHDR